MFRRIFEGATKYCITGQLSKNKTDLGHCIIKITEGSYLTYKWNSSYRKVITFDVGNEVFERYLDNTVKLAYHDGTRKFELFDFLFEVDERYPSETVEEFRLTLCRFIWEAMNNEKVSDSADYQQYCTFFRDTKIGGWDELFIFDDEDTYQYVSQGKVTYTFKNLRLVVRGEGHDLLLDEEIKPEMNMKFNTDVEGEMTARWFNRFANQVYNWCIKFKDVASFEEFKRGYTCEMFAFGGKDWDKLSAEDKHWTTHHNSVEWENFREPKEIATEEQHVDQMTVGTLSNRAFISNDKMIEIFDPDKMRTTGQFGTGYVPSELLLHRGENNLMTLDEDNINRVYNTDLHTGQVVREWDTQFGYRKLAHTAKANSQSREPTMWGMNRLGFMKLDTRTRDLVVQNYMYSAGKKPNFTCIATSMFGEVVTGSADGYVRLYNPQKWKSDITPRAITSFPLYAEPIIGVDINFDGTLIVATCKTFLMLLETHSGGKNGFHESLGIDRKPPTILRLSNTDCTKVGEVNFTKAHFGNDKVVTSTGNYVITWDLKKKRYTMERMGERVVDVDFKWTTDELIVATPETVNVIH